MDGTRLREMLEASDIETRLSAAQHLTQTSEPPLDAIRRAMEDEAIAVRTHAIEAAAKFLPPDELVSLVANQHNAILRNAAIEALKLTGSPGALALLSALSHQDAEVVMFAAQILGDIKADFPVEPMLVLLTHEDKNIAQSAIETLGKKRSVDAVPALVDVLENDFWLQFAAITALGEIADARATLPLVARLQDEMYRGEAAEALGKISDPQAMTPLLDVWKEDTWPPLRARVTLAIARIAGRHPETLKEIETRLAGDDVSLLRTLLSTHAKINRSVGA
jgi:HEAT repeat protein